MIVGYPTETLQDHESQLRSIEKYADYAKSGTIFMLRWGLTMHIYDDTPITRYANELELMHTGDDNHHDSMFTWVSGKNQTLDINERIRRRVEIPEESVKHGYSMPNARSELQSILTLAEIASKVPKDSKLIPIITS